MTKSAFGEPEIRKEYGVYTPAGTPAQEARKLTLLQAAHRLTVLETALLRRQEELDAAIAEIKQVQVDFAAGNLTVEDVSLLMNKWGHLSQ